MRSEDVIDTASPLEALARLGMRFYGVSLDFRRAGTPWPAPWRAECFASAHERARQTAYGETPAEAIAGLLRTIDETFVTPPAPAPG